MTGRTVNVPASLSCRKTASRPGLGMGPAGCVNKASLKACFLCLLHLRDLRLQRSHHDFCSLLSLQRSLVVAQSFLNLESLNQENTSTLEAAHGCILHGGLCFPDMPKSSLLCDLATTTKRDGARCRGTSFSSVPGRVRVPRALHAKSSPRRASSP